jgi:hypothetical protein
MGAILSAGAAQDGEIELQAGTESAEVIDPQQQAFT